MYKKKFYQTRLSSLILRVRDNKIMFIFRKVFDNIYQILRPGGKALVLFLASNSGFDAYLDVAKNPKYKTYMEVNFYKTISYLIM